MIRFARSREVIMFKKHIPQETVSNSQAPEKKAGAIMFSIIFINNIIK